MLSLNHQLTSFFNNHLNSIYNGIKWFIIILAGSVTGITRLTIASGASANEPVSSLIQLYTIIILTVGAIIWFSFWYWCLWKLGEYILSLGNHFKIKWPKVSFYLSEIGLIIFSVVANFRIITFTSQVSGSTNIFLQVSFWSVMIHLFWHLFDFQHQYPDKFADFIKAAVVAIAVGAFIGKTWEMVANSVDPLNTYGQYSAGLASWMIAIFFLIPLMDTVIKKITLIVKNNQ